MIKISDEGRLDRHFSDRQFSVLAHHFGEDKIIFSGGFAQDLTLNYMALNLDGNSEHGAHVRRKKT